MGLKNILKYLKLSESIFRQMRHLTLSLHSELPLFKGWRNTAGGVIRKVSQVPLGLCLTHMNVFFVGKSVGEEWLFPFSLLWILYTLH